MMDQTTNNYMINPINNNILFKPFAADIMTEGGILIADSCKKESNKGVIVAVGNGTKLRPMKLQPNTIGFRVKDWGEEVIIDGETHYLMDDKAILALE